LASKPCRLSGTGLNDEDYRRLKGIAEYHQTTLTGAVELVLRVARPTAVLGVQDVGVRGRRRVNIQFSNGMIVHGFLWSRGGQLLAPSIPNPRGQGYIRLVNGTREFWHSLRRFVAAELGVDDVPVEEPAPDREGELVF
jgi:hypothetical protein